MRVTNTLLLFAGLALCQAWRSAAADVILETPLPRTNAPALSAELRHDSGEGIMDSDWVYISAGTNRYAFLAPAGMRLDGAGENRIVLRNEDLSCVLSVRVLDVPFGEEVNSQYARQILQAEHSNASVVGERGACANGRPGPALDAEWYGPAGALKCERVALIPCHSKVLEFATVCSRESFGKGQRYLSTVMLTFRASDANGKLTIVHLSNKL